MNVNLFGKRIKLKNLKAKSSWIIWVGPNSMTSVLIRVTPRRGMEESEIGVTSTKPRKAWSRQKQEEIRKDSLLEAKEGAWSC